METQFVLLQVDTEFLKFYVDKFQVLKGETSLTLDKKKTMKRHILSDEEMDDIGAGLLCHPPPPPCSSSSFNVACRETRLTPKQSS
jgi:hypothetical protein